MYRLSNHQDPHLQSIVTREILNGFRAVFHFDPMSGKTDPYLTAFFFEDVLDEEMDPEPSRQHACRFIEKLGQELSDPYHEYTFNEYGEYVLFKASAYLWAVCMANTKAVTGIPEKILSNAEKIIPLTWGSSASEEEQTYVSRFARHLYIDLMDEFKDDPETDDVMWHQTENFIRRCLYFPFLHTEIEDEIPLVFWDEDFLLYEEYGIEGFEQIRNSIIGESLGMSLESARTEPVSGSSRYPIHTYH